MNRTQVHQTLKRKINPQIRALQKEVLSYYRLHGRHNLPWRKTKDPYKIMVSEIMLQQTQALRVIEKYKEFLNTFPSIYVLAGSPLSNVLKLWSGLGYNRRAKFLHEAAKMVMNEYKGKMPRTAEELEKLPGIGPYTAQAIAAFAYNTPSAFIETNIRTVFIHHFFGHTLNVDDRQLLVYVEKAAEGQDAREWYAALMDYGSHLKQTVGNASQRSAHHVKQKAFKGSMREARGQILKLLSITTVGLTKSHIVAKTKLELDRVEQALGGLEGDGLIALSKGKWRIA